MTLPWSRSPRVVVAIFSLVGFEAATAFGDEAKDPLKTIRRFGLMSLTISGAFLRLRDLRDGHGTTGLFDSLDKIDQPLNILAQVGQLPILQIPLSLGAMLSFFALCLSCISSGGGSSMRWAARPVPCFHRLRA